MDGLLMMNFLSRFFTPLLSELSEELCFSLELPNISGGGGGVRGQTGSYRVTRSDRVREAPWWLAFSLGEGLWNQYSLMVRP